MPRNATDSDRSAAVYQAYIALDDDDREIVSAAAQRLRKIKHVGPGLSLEIIAALGMWLEEHPYAIQRR